MLTNILYLWYTTNHMKSIWLVVAILSDLYKPHTKFYYYLLFPIKKLNSYHSKFLLLRRVGVAFVSGHSNLWSFKNVQLYTLFLPQLEVDRYSKRNSDKSINASKFELKDRAILSTVFQMAPPKGRRHSFVIMGIYF